MCMGMCNTEIPVPLALNKIYVFRWEENVNGSSWSFTIKSLVQQHVEFYVKE